MVPYEAYLSKKVSNFPNTYLKEDRLPKGSFTILYPNCKQYEKQLYLILISPIKKNSIITHSFLPISIFLEARQKKFLEPFPRLQTTIKE